MEQDKQNFGEGGVELRQYILLLASKWWLVLSSVLLATVLGLTFALFQQDVFESRVQLLITVPIEKTLLEGERAELVQIQRDLPVGADLSDETLGSLATSSDILAAVIQSVDLRDSSTGVLWSTIKLQNMMKPRVDRGQKEGSLASLPLLTMNVRGSDPSQVKQIAEAWSEVFLKENTELFESEAARSFEFVESRYESVGLQLLEKQREKLEVLEESSLLIITTERDALVSNLAGFFRKLEGNKAQLASTRGELVGVRRAMVGQLEIRVIERSIGSDVISEFLIGEPEPSEILALPKLIFLEQELNEIYVALKSQESGLITQESKLLAEVADLEVRISELIPRIKLITDKSERINAVISDFNAEIGALSAISVSLVGRLEDARLETGRQLGVIRVVQAAVQPNSPVSPNRSRILQVAGAVGLLFGIVGAFSIDSFASKRR